MAYGLVMLCLSLMLHIMVYARALILLYTLFSMVICSIMMLQVEKSRSITIWLHVYVKTLLHVARVVDLPLSRSVAVTMIICCSVLLKLGDSGYIMLYPHA